MPIIKLCATVLDIYEFTSFSNNPADKNDYRYVLDIYEFTSFSNHMLVSCPYCGVLDIYEFTSFSNDRDDQRTYAQVLDIYEFTSFSNGHSVPDRRSAFWISTNLHHSQTYRSADCTLYWFWISTNLHHSQTLHLIHIFRYKFWISTNLHHSQTSAEDIAVQQGFGYLRIYIILKQEPIHCCQSWVLDIYEFTSFSN